MLINHAEERLRQVMLEGGWAEWEQGSRNEWQEMDALVDMLDSLENN